MDLDGLELTKDVFRKCCSYVEQVLLRFGVQGLGFRVEGLGFQTSS